MNLLKLSPSEERQQAEIREHGRVIARGMHDVQVEQQKNMAKAAKRNQTMLSRAADRALSGGVQSRRP